MLFTVAERTAFIEAFYDIRTTTDLATNDIYTIKKYHLIKPVFNVNGYVNTQNRCFWGVARVGFYVCVFAMAV